MKKLFCSHSDCVARALREISGRHRDKKMFLDVGCGDGARSVLFANYARTICGVDRTNWLQASVQHSIDFRQEDLVETGLSYSDASFDIVLSFDLIEHLPEPGIMLGEIHRILKPDGVFVIATPNRHRLCGLVLIMLGLRKFPWYPGKDNINTDPYCAHVREYTFSELRDLMGEEGFRVVRDHRLFYNIGRYGVCTFFSLPFYHTIILECVKIEVNQDYTGSSLF